MSKPVVALLASFGGAVHETTADASADVALTLLGAPRSTDADGNDASPAPRAFVALTVHE